MLDYIVNQDQLYRVIYWGKGNCLVSRLHQSNFSSYYNWLAATVSSSFLLIILFYLLIISPLVIHHSQARKSGFPDQYFFTNQKVSTIGPSTKSKFQVPRTKYQDHPTAKVQQYFLSNSSMPMICHPTHLLLLKLRTVKPSTRPTKNKR